METMESFISVNIRELLIDLLISKENNITGLETKFISADLTLCWDPIRQEIFNKLPDNFTIHEQSPDWFVDTISKCQIVWKQSLSYLRAISDRQKITLLNNCSWTQRQSDIELYLDKFLNSPVDLSKSTTNVEVVLLVTSILERSLGNIYLLRGTSVPFLLRELLCTAELFQLIGQIPILFMQVLLGTPLGINIRNLTWHGFPAPHEVHPCYAAILFIITASIGEILTQNNIAPQTIPFRPQVVQMDVYIPHTININLYNKYSATYLIKFFQESSIIAKSHYVYWEQIFIYFTRRKYGECLLLLVPQFEHLMRIAFCKLNNVPKRLLTAESHSLYTTLDEILNENVEIANGKEIYNNIFSTLGVPFMELLNDLFKHLDGPRIRDKLSHGEINLCDVSEPCMNILLCTSLLIIDTIDNAWHFDWCSKLNLNQYRSMYHPKALVRESIIRALTELSDLNTLLKPVGLCILPCQDNADWQALNMIIWSKIGNTENYSPTDLVEFVHNMTVKTINCRKYNAEIYSLLRRIVLHVSITINNIQNSLNEKLILYNKRLLRSKRRETFSKLWQMIPTFCECLKNIITVVIWNFCLAQNETNSVQDPKVKRYLKSILQCAENMAVNMEPQKNHWEESVQISRKYFILTNDHVTYISTNN